MQSIELGSSVGAKILSLLPRRADAHLSRRVQALRSLRAGQRDPTGEGTPIAVERAGPGRQGTGRPGGGAALPAGTPLESGDVTEALRDRAGLHLTHGRSGWAGDLVPAMRGTTWGDAVDRLRGRSRADVVGRHLRRGHGGGAGDIMARAMGAPVISTSAVAATASLDPLRTGFGTSLSLAGRAPSRSMLFSGLVQAHRLNYTSASGTYTIVGAESYPSPDPGNHCPKVPRIVP